MISTETRDGVAVVTLQHGKVNALDVELLGAIEREFCALNASPPSAAILTGAGKAFSAGVDLIRLVREGADYAEALLDGLDRTLGALFNAPYPVVAAINGHAIAGGHVLACACDHRLMAEGKGRIGVPELVVGVPWPTMALEMVCQAYSPNRAAELVYLGQTYAPEEALAREYVDQLVPADTLLERAQALAQELGAIPSAAFRVTKSMLHRSTLDKIALLDPERREEIRLSWRSPETMQIVRDYLGRTIGWTG